MRSVKELVPLKKTKMAAGAKLNTLRLTPELKTKS